MLNIKRITTTVLFFGIISNTSYADIIYNKVTKPEDISNNDFTLGLSDSYIKITNTDSVVKKEKSPEDYEKIAKMLSEASPDDVENYLNSQQDDTSIVQSNAPRISVNTYINAQKNIAGTIKNKWNSGNLTLTLVKDENTGQLKSIKSETIPFSEKLATALKPYVPIIIEVVKVIIDVIAAIEPPEPSMSEKDRVLDAQKCIQYEKKYLDNFTIPIDKTISDVGGVQKVKGQNGKECISIQYEAPPVTAYPYNDLIDKQLGNYLLSSSCRTALISIQQTEDQLYQEKITYIDSNYLEATAIPKNGKLEKTSCGFKEVAS